MSLYLPLWMQAATGDTAITYGAQDFRLMVGALAAHAGTVLAGDLAVTQRGAGANMSVDVAAGRAFIPGTTIANEGSYIVRSDATYNVTLAAASTANPRIDLIVAQVLNKQVDGGSTYGWTLKSVTGTPAASPVAPSLPASSLLLAQVSVATNATSVVTANITDKRVLACVSGGDIPQWDYSGTTGQSIPTGSDTVYVPSNLFKRVGMGTTGTVGELVCITPGRYQVNFGTSMPASASANDRNVGIRHYLPDGTTLVRTAFNTYSGVAYTSLAVSGNFQLAVGDRVRATIFQNSSGSVTTTDTSKTNLFTGIWLGP